MIYFPETESAGEAGYVNIVAVLEDETKELLTATKV